MMAPNPHLWTAADAAAATGGRAIGDWAAQGVSIDSRSIDSDDLFVALKGPNFDGADYVADALRLGAAAAMVTDVPAGLSANAPLLIVDDTLRGLEQLGVAGRTRAAARIVAVTGSVGKTSVKEALGYLLSRQGDTGFSSGSFNNHFGVPLSLSRLAPHAAYGVFELGMNHAGELTPLSKMVRPHVAIITTIEAAHLENFDSLADIARAKAEIFAGLEAGGTALLNRDNAYFDLLADLATEAGAEIASFGRQDDARFRLLSAEPAGNGTDIDMMINDDEVQFHLPLPGDHWVSNAMAIMAGISLIGADVIQAADDISELKPANRRGERHRVHFAGMCFEIIDDSYNASPAAVNAALSVLGAAHPGPSGRRIAVLGDMLELGGNSPALHQGLKDGIESADVDLVFAAGPQMKCLFKALEPDVRGEWTADAASLVPVLMAAVHSGDVVLVKGSAGMKMGQVVDALKNLGMPSLRASNGG